jgi:hypothetical protein
VGRADALDIVSPQRLLRFGDSLTCRVYKVHATEHRMELINPGKLGNVFERIRQAGMSTAQQHHYAFD